MIIRDKIKEVGFADKNLRKAYLKLQTGKSEEKQLFSFISRAIDDMKKNPLCGMKIPEKLIPKGISRNTESII